MATFGKTDIGAATGGINANYKVACKYNLSEVGTITQISWYLASTNCNAKVAIYDDDGAGGYPSTLLVESSAVACLAGQWNNFAVNVFLPAGDYWLVVKTDTAGTRYSFDTTGAVTADRVELYADPFSNPFGATGSYTRAMSIYATYTPAGGGEEEEEEKEPWNKFPDFSSKIRGMQK